MDKSRQAHFNTEIIDGRFHADIFAGVVDFWRGHVLTSIFGAAAIYGALRGVGAVLHAMGVC